MRNAGNQVKDENVDIGVRLENNLVLHIVKVTQMCPFIQLHYLNQQARQHVSAI